MDELKVNSRFMRRIISQIIEKMIYKKVGYKVRINVGELNVIVTDENAHIILKAEGDMSINELKKITSIIDSRE